MVVARLRSHKNYGLFFFLQVGPEAAHTLINAERRASNAQSGDDNPDGNPAGTSQKGEGLTPSNRMYLSTCKHCVHMECLERYQSSLVGQIDRA